MALPKTPEEYYQLVENRLNIFERTTRHASSLDERMDMTNLLLIELVRLMGGSSPDGEPSPGPTKAWPENTVDAVIMSVAIDVAGTAYEIPSISVPSGFSAVLKAWPDNTGTLYLAFTSDECLTIVRSWPLLPGEYISWQLQNTNAVFVSGTSANDRLVVTVERRIL